MLASTWHNTSGIPVAFLHGFLGSQQDWDDVLTILQNFPQIRPLVIDLPYHNQSQHIPCESFEEMRALLDLTFQSLGHEHFYIVGYSLGGRLALDYAMHVRNPDLKGILLEGANIGLSSSQERAERWQNDCHWAERFNQEPLKDVLDDWYQQTVFAHLTPNQRAELVEKRSKNNGQDLAKMLKATSLAKQAYVSPTQIQAYSGKIAFIIGEQDQKFRQMVETHSLPYHLVANAGHNAHSENPQEFVQKLLQFILN